MEKMWMRSVVMVAACLSIVACGKSKSGGDVSAAPAKPVSTGTLSRVSTGTLPGPVGSGTLSPVTSGTLNPVSSGTLAPVSAGTLGSSGDMRDRSRTRPAPAVPADAATSSNPTAEAIQGMLADSDRYSGAAEDSLRDLLTYKQMQKPDTAQKARDIQLAYKIQKATLEQNMLTGTMKINLTIAQNGANAVVGLATQRTDSGAMSLAANAKDFSGSISCLDAVTDKNSPCGTSVAEIKYKNASVQIIFRHTALVLNAVFPDRACLTAECENLYDFFRYSERKIVEANTLKSAVMDSSEVILGKSMFSVKIITNDNQVMKMTGPLANPLIWQTLDTPVDLTLTSDDLMDPKTRQVRKNSMQQTLNDVRITNNDGRGNVNLLVKMKVREDGSRDTFEIRLNRIVKPITGQVEVIATAQK